jgi:hypothetical protein
LVSRLRGLPQGISAEGLVDEMGLDPTEVLRWAERLIIDAGFHDPLDNWITLIRQTDPDRWEDLKGDALSAVGHRVAAEILLAFYEDLVEAGVRPPYLPFDLVQQWLVQIMTFEAVIVSMSPTTMSSRCALEIATFRR